MPCLLVSALVLYTNVLLVGYAVPYLCFLLVITLFKIALKCTVELLASGPNPRRLCCAL